MTSRRFIGLIFSCLLAISPALAERKVDHVIILSIDGGKPKVILQTEMPQLQRLVQEGAHTWVANTIFPPKTLPSHTSMVTGVGPEKHGILWNDWMPLRGMVKVPTIFSLVKAADPEAGTAWICGKGKFRHLWLPGSLDVFDLNGPQQPGPASMEFNRLKAPAQKVAGQVKGWLAEHQPQVMMVHFPDVDAAGHASGWGSPEQQEALRVVDQALGQVVRAEKDSPMADSSVIIVTADHGGHEKNHAENIPDDMNIPWIAWGKGVKPGFEIQQPVTTYDTAATALWLLGLEVPASFDGKPVVEAFDFPVKAAPAGK
ncbi:MAG: alkaline phosphatase family protein [Verrucomicrobiales bacterium]|nr:alkaline phosphatase family protein [Verrucomicrobiales bacterium]